MPIKDYINNTKKFHDKKYLSKGYNFQRKFPNEDVIRFENKFLKKSSKILDIGCGTGRNVTYLIKKKHTVHCLDFSNHAINLLKKLLKKKKLNKSKYKLIIDSIPKMKKVNDNYDAIIDCFTSYALIKKDFEIYIENIYKRLKKSGVIHLQILSKKSDLFKKS